MWTPQQDMDWERGINPHDSPSMSTYYAHHRHGDHRHILPWRTHGRFHTQRIPHPIGSDIGDIDHYHPHERAPGYQFNPRYPHSLANIAAPMNHAHTPPNALEAPLHANNNFPLAGKWDFHDQEYVFT